MKKRVLGRSGLQVSAIGFGCMGLNFGYANSVSKDEGIRLIRAALERGVTFGSTATLVAPNDPGSTTDAASGTSLKTAAAGSASWVMFGADGLPRRFTPNVSATPPCTALGPAAQAAAAIYVKNSARNYGVVMTPLGLSRLHRYITGSPNRWTP